MKADHLASQNQNAADAAVAAFSASIADGQPFEVAAVSLGGSVSTETIGLREAAILPQTMTANLFSSTIGTLVDGRLPGALNEVVVAQTETVRFGPNGQLDALGALISRQVGSEMSQGLFAAYLDAASDTYRVRRNDEEIARRFGVN